MYFRSIFRKKYIILLQILSNVDPARYQYFGTCYLMVLYILFTHLLKEDNYVLVIFKYFFFIVFIDLRNV